MKHHIVIDGNAFYEVDDECMKKREEQERKKYSEKKNVQKCLEKEEKRNS